MKNRIKGYFSFGDVVEVFVDTCFDDVDFHCEGFIVNFGEFADEVIAEVEGLTILFVL